MLDDNLDNQMSVFNNSNNRSIHGSKRLNPSSPALKPAVTENDNYIIQAGEQQYASIRPQVHTAQIDEQ